MNLYKVTKSLEKKGWLIASGILLWIALASGYYFFVNPIYQYSGFTLNISWLKTLESLAIYSVLMGATPSRLRKPSDYFLAFLLFSVITPLLIFYSLADQDRYSLYIVLTGYILTDIFRRGPNIKFPTLKGGPTIAIVIVSTSALIVSGWFVWSGGIRFFNLDPTEVYNFREDVSEVIDAGLMGYLNFWAYKVFGPTLLAIGLWKRKLWLVIFALFLHVYWFGVSSHKSVLFFPFLIFFLWFWFRQNRALSIIPLAITGVISLALIIYILTGIELPASMFIRRVFFVVANNTFYYYEFFSQNPHTYWSYSITSAFVDYPYQVNPAQVIGNSRGTGNHVNNTYLSTGYMHAGFFGIMLYGFLAGLIFKTIDSIATSGIPNWVAIAVLIVPSRSMLVSADLPTSLSTHGIAVGILILVLLRSNEFATTGKTLGGVHQGNR